MTQTKTTYCRICEATCGLEVDVEAGRVVAIRPDREHPVSRGFACVKGMKFGEVHRDPDRLRHPMHKVDGVWERTSWDDVNRSIGASLRRILDEHGPHAIGLYFGNPSAFSLASPIASQGFVRGLGTRNVFSAGSQDCNEKFAVSQRLYGSSLIQPVPDFASTKFLLLLGTNPAVSQMSFVHAPHAMDKLRDIADRGGRVVLLDPRRTETASASYVEHHFIRPDTDPFLLAAIAKLLVARGHVDRAVVSRHVRGFESLEDALVGVDVDACAVITGVDVATIESLAEALGTTEGAAIHASTGVNQGSNASVSYYLVQSILAMTGNLDRRGGVVVAEHLVPVIKWVTRAGLDRSPHRSRIGDFVPVMGTMPATILADEILTPGKDKIRALIVVAGNPLLSCPNSQRLAEAFSSLELLVTIDLYRNETGELGTHALPAVDFFERADFPLPFLTFQPEPFVQWTDAVAEPAGESRDELRIFADLAEAAGIPFFGVPGLARAFRLGRKLGRFDPFDPARSVDLMLRAIGLDLSKLRAAPHGLLRAPNRPGSFLGKRVLTRDGRVDLGPADLVASLRALVASTASRRAAIASDDSLLLFSKREKTSHNTWMHNVDSLVKARRHTNFAHIHPKDAASRGIVEKSLVEVTSATGRIVLPVAFDADVMPGSIAIPHGWGHERAKSLRVASATTGSNVNDLAADGPAATERISGMAQLVGIRVRVRPHVTAAQGLPAPAE